MKQETNETGENEPVYNRLASGSNTGLIPLDINNDKPFPAQENTSQQQQPIINSSKSLWSAIGDTVQGASHKRTDKPNQDAMKWLPKSKDVTQLIIAVADGHGSEKSFRSKYGAQKAVNIAIKMFRDVVSCIKDDTSLSTIKDQLESRLPILLVQKWVDHIRRHLKLHPITDDEFTSLRNKSGENACEVVKKNPLLAYGTTLLTAIINDRYCYFMQLGDGDIILVSDNGETSQPLPRDERLIGNETTSLCLKDAWKDFRMSFQALAGTPPALIILSTDGYSNSFQQVEGFLNAGSDFLSLLRDNGPVAIREQLSIWLNETSLMGSGDDITLVLAYRNDAIKKVKQNLEIREKENVTE